MEQHCVMVGTGHACPQLIASLRQYGWQGQITAIGQEPGIAYHRPPLSKDFLTGTKQADTMHLRPEEFYHKNQVNCFFGRTVESIDRSNNAVSLDDGSQHSYSQLVLGTGARPRHISIPGHDLAGVHYLRTMTDSLAIRADIQPGRHAVIIGGGYIGLECAASLKKQGMHVTVMEMADRILARVTTPEVSKFYTRLHREEGVVIETGVTIIQLFGKDKVESGVESKVKSIVLGDGSERPADMVIVGIGVLPNIELAEAAGLAVENGITVDEQCRTSDADIYAIGDCSFFPSHLYGRRMRLESVANAMEHAKLAAATICGVEASYNAVPWFWSDQYDVKLQIAGLHQGHDATLVRGDPKSGRSFTTFYLKDNRLICADCINAPKDFMLSKKHIASQEPIQPETLLGS